MGVTSRDLREQLRSSRNPYKHVLDETHLAYCDTTRTYTARFRKVIENIDTLPLNNAYIRLMVCATPTDVELARKFYERNPISLKSLGFQIWDDDGRSLKTSIIHAEPNNIELLVWFEDEETGEAYSIRQGERVQINYEMTLPDSVWGPFLLRHIRWQCDEVRVQLDFPKGLVSIKSESIGVKEPWKAADPPFSRRVGPSELWNSMQGDMEVFTRGTREYFCWKERSPAIGAFYRFSWRFADSRYEDFLARLCSEMCSFRHEARSGSRVQARARAKEFIDRGLVHAESDFRSVFWFGEWFQFTPIQARCVDLLWHNWVSGAVGLGGDYLLEEAESLSPKLSAVFRRSKAWKRGVIYSPRRGIYSLRSPTDLVEIDSVTPLCRPAMNILDESEA